MPVRSEAVMGTIVTIHVVRRGSEDSIERAFGWFREIEARCTRFDANSELMQLCSQIGTASPVSTILFEALRFALLMAEETGGAFDPTVGGAMTRRGFDREHRTGTVVPARGDADVSYRDVTLDEQRRTVTLRRPLTLDLGAVAKGLAVDAAARELSPWQDFAIDAGGDLFLSGLNPQGQDWSAGIRHPRRDGELLETLRVSNEAVCTSGDYERGEHILDPRSGEAAHAAVSATVIAPTAMAADALATAAFVLGREGGIALLERMNVKGLIVTADLECHRTRSLGLAA